MDYIGEVGFNALHKPKVTSSFATLDVNRDGKIDKSDSDATSDSKIKNEIDIVLDSIKLYDNYTGECGFSTKINFGNPNFYKEYPEFAEFAHSQGFTVPGEEQEDEAELANLGMAGALFKFAEMQTRQPTGVLDEYLNNKYGNPEGVENTQHFAGFEGEYEYAHSTGNTIVGNKSINESSVNGESTKTDYKQIQLEKRENELKKIEEEYTDLENEIKEKQEEYNVLMEQINSESEDEDVSTKQEEANGIEYELKTKNRDLEYLANDIYDLKNIIELSKSLM